MRGGGLQIERRYVALLRAITNVKMQPFRRLEFEGLRPVQRGKTVFFVHPSSLRGKRAPLDFEDALGVPCQVVHRLLERMWDPAGRGERAGQWVNPPLL